MHHVGTATRRVAITEDAPQSWPAAQQLVEVLLHTCDQLISRHAPDWLGHCKALLEADGGCAYASLTAAGEPISWRGSLENIDALTLTLYGAVYGVPDAVLQTVVEQALQTHVPNARPMPPPEAHGSSTVELL